MKKSFLNKLATGCRRQPGDRLAFTLTELLVVLGCVALLAVVVLSVAFTPPVSVLRAQCVSNLRQIGVGWSMYSSDNNALMPCNWPGICVDNVVGAGSASSSWRTHEIERVVPGTGIMATGDGTTTTGGVHQTMSGWWNLGKLWPNRFVADPRIFYCPSGVPPLVNQNLMYAYYTNPTNNPPQPWPTDSGSQAAGDNEVRVAYDYFPQARTLQLVGNFLGPVPAVTQGGLDVTKCIVTDQMLGYDTLAHRADGVAGANALFPDGHVKWENAKANPAAFNLTSIGPYAWGLTSASGSIGQSGSGITTFRYVKAHLPP
jgi:prepilin-type processing-associated H-X9-DG protein